MTFKNYLQNHQKIVYNTFCSAVKNNRLSHAYLIKGNEGAPLLETAKFLAKSLVCENGDPFACDNCMACVRFDENNFADFKILNGQENNIKVSDIESLQSFFQNTPSETCGKMIYIIHLLENSNKESLNALLKFLEEPQENVYAFITTYNEEKLLPTILSRTQHLKLLPLPLVDIINQAKEHGVSEDDAELISQFYSNVDTLIEVASSSNYQKVKDLVFDTLDQLIISPKQALFFVQKSIIPSLKDKVSVRLFLDIFATIIKDVVQLSYGKEPILKSHKVLLSSLLERINNVDEIYREIMFMRGQIELNINLGLIFDHLFIFIINQGGN